MSTVVKVLIALLHLDHLRNNEHFQAHTEVLLLLEESDAAALHIDDGLIGRHKAELATLDEAIKKIVKSPRTKLLQEADKRRDKAYRGMAAFNKAICLHSEELISAAAERVQIAIDTYGSVLKMNYEEETSAVYNLVQDLKSTKYAPDVLAIGLRPWVEKLEAANNNVSSLISARDNENAAKSHVNTLAARVDIDETYTIIVDRVNSYAKKEMTPAIAEFITKLNLIVKRFNTLIKQHHGHHHSHGAAEEGSGEEEGEGSEGTEA